MVKTVSKQTAASTAAKPRGRRSELVGQVISDKMHKTIAVEVYRLVKHDRYSKYVRRSTVFKAHDEKNDAKIGDRVLIVASRPLSKTKRWSLVKILDRAGQQPEANV